MSNELSPVDQLRRALFEQSKEACDPEKVAQWTDDFTLPENVHQIANGLPIMLGHFRSNSTNRLNDRVDAYGFRSIPELRVAVVGLRDQLKDELTEDDWNIYFGKTIDIT